MSGDARRWPAAVALIAAAWGSVAVMVQAIDLPAGAIAFYRVCIAAASVWLGAALLRRLNLLAAGRSLRGLVALGLLLGVHWLAYFATIKLSSVALGVLLTYTGPLVVAALAPRMLGAPTDRGTLVALAAGAAGVATVAADGGSEVDVSLAALATGIFAGFTFGLLIIAGRALAPRVSAPAFTFWEMLTASVLLLPVAAGGRMMPPDWGDAAGLVLLGVGATAALMLAFARVLRHVEAQRVAVLMYIEPVSSVLLAWLVLSETPSPQTLVGGAIVLAAGAAIVARGSPAAEPGAPVRV